MQHDITFPEEQDLRFETVDRPSKWEMPDKEQRTLLLQRAEDIVSDYESLVLLMQEALTQATHADP